MDQIVSYEAFHKTSDQKLFAKLTESSDYRGYKKCGK